eukprot:m.195574 g.195574  ORF g.195574 m.195574 type:complete len:139 (+) comp15233_c0_seq1:621-1037(+)
MNLMTPDPTVGSAGMQGPAAALMAKVARILRNALTVLPITVTVAGSVLVRNRVFLWPTLYQSTALDFIELHPYVADLDVDIIESVRLLRSFGKPVLIGECGLQAGRLANGTLPRPRWYHSWIVGPAGVRRRQRTHAVV